MRAPLNCEKDKKKAKIEKQKREKRKKKLRKCFKKINEEIFGSVHGAVLRRIGV